MLVFSVFLFLFPSMITASLSHDADEVEFRLYPSKWDPEFYQEILFEDDKSLSNSHFLKNLKTVFIVHGFGANGSSEVAQMLKNAYLHSGLHNNIIVVDWGVLSTPLPPPLTGALYSLVAIKNVKIVGERIAEFILWLDSKNFLSLSEVHLIGHSLGAHASGYAGRYMQAEKKQKFGRITGLDPAGPLFDPPVRTRNLRQSDAHFVDIIHTNSGELGVRNDGGHVDFRPNGGAMQPSCEEVTKKRERDVCAHRFSYKLYAASLKKKYKACKCGDALTREFLSLCLLPCREPVSLGVNTSTTARGFYYLETA